MIASSIVQKKLYSRLLTLLYEAHASHIGSSLSCLDIIAQIMGFEMKSSDKFILSKGHAAPALYVVLNYLKKITDEELKTFHANGTKLSAHPPHHFRDLIPFPSGSLGHGLSISAGMAQGYVLTQQSKEIPRVFCLMSDGECNEGQVWEAAQYASRFELYNLVALIDKNKIQAFGRTENVLGDSAAREKWEAFGFDVFECDGHSPKNIHDAMNKATKSKSRKPKLLICNTVKGHGVSFMEDKIAWHYNVLTDEQYKQAIDEINTKYEN